MSTPKKELRDVMIDVIFKKERVQYPPDRMGVLFTGVAEVLARRSGKSTHDPRLSPEDEATATEICSDLIHDRIITPGRDAANPFPCFRVHSEASYPDGGATPS